MNRSIAIKETGHKELSRGLSSQKHTTEAYSSDIVNAVIERYKSGDSVPSLCYAYGISARSTIYRWLDLARPAHEDVISKRQLRDLKKELTRLNLENKILKEAGCSETSPVSIRQEAFCRLSKLYPLKTLCRILALTPGDGHYLRDHKVTTPQRVIRDKELETRIKKAFDKSHGTYGKRRIKAMLNRDSISVSERKISQLMAAMNLIPKHVEYHWIRNPPTPNYYPNKLEQDFDQRLPNLVWTADITYCRIENGWRYFFAVIDLCSRRVIGWGLSDCKTSAFTTTILKRAFHERGEPRGVLYHVDQGSENTDYCQREWARCHGIERSYSRAGHPHDNAVSESFFSTFKKEFVCKRVFASEEILYDEIDAYIHFYNEVRLHTYNVMESPCEAESTLFNGCVKILD